MNTRRERAERYRREAQTCLEFAAQLSLRADRNRVIEMADHWTSLAQRADSEADFEQAWSKETPD